MSNNKSYKIKHMPSLETSTIEQQKKTEPMSVSVLHQNRDASAWCSTRTYRKIVGLTLYW